MITIGQDATGRWAWILRDSGGRFKASQDDYETGDAAFEDAAVMKLAYDTLLKKPLGGR